MHSRGGSCLYGWELQFLLTSAGPLLSSGSVVIIVAEQTEKKYLAEQFEAFWAVVGVMFMVAGISGVLGNRVNLIAVTCIIAGLTLLVSTLLRK
jgi:hypothetical protein